VQPIYTTYKKPFMKRCAPRLNIMLSLSSSSAARFRNNSRITKRRAKKLRAMAVRSVGMTTATLGSGPTSSSCPRAATARSR